MNFLHTLGDMLERYVGADATQPPKNVDNDYDEVTRQAPGRSIAEGIAEAFRSEQTPPFPKMVADLFSRADSHQKATLLNGLLSAAGPAMIAALGRDPRLASVLGKVKEGFTVTPQEAEEVSVDEVHTIASKAKDEDPSIVERVSQFWADQPQLFKTLGAAALTVILAGIAKKRNIM